MLGNTAEAEAAFHIYASAVGALYEAFAPMIEQRELHELYYEVELPLCAVLARMEHTGMRVDANALAAFGSEMEAQLKTLEQHIYEEAGGPFNINSPKQLGEVLFERLQLPHGKRRKPAGRRTRTCLKSSAGRTPSSKRCCNTASTQSSARPIATDF